jgi:hypothetical protein
MKLRGPGFASHPGQPLLFFKTKTKTFYLHQNSLFPRDTKIHRLSISRVQRKAGPFHSIKNSSNFERAVFCCCAPALDIGILGLDQGIIHRKNYSIGPIQHLTDNLAKRYSILVELPRK